MLVLMHEGVVATALAQKLRQIAQQHGVRRILAVRVRLGLMSGVVPEALQFAFQVQKNDALLENCRLDLEMIPMELRCPSCGFCFPAPALHERCPQCGAWAYATSGSSEIILASVEAED